MIIILLGLQRPKQLLAFINPIGGKKTAEKDFRKTITPILQFAGIACKAFGKTHFALFYSYLGLM